MQRLFDNHYPRRVAVATALLVSTALASAGCTSSTTNVSSSSPQAPLELPSVVNQAGFAAIVAKVKPAVVNIVTSKMTQPADTQEMPSVLQGSPSGNIFKQFFAHQGTAVPGHALGAGFIVDPAGYVVTNNHVVDGAAKVMVTLHDGSSYPAKIVGGDPETDIAVLKIDAGRPLPYLVFGNSDKELVGDWVVAVGDPFGLGETVTAGIVSAHDRNVNGGPSDDFLQIDAPINPGNSGGPLFNQSGRVIGVDTALYSPNGGNVGIAFAIPSNIASKIVARLREHGGVEPG